MNKEIQKLKDLPGDYEITKVVGDIRVGHHKYLHVLQNQYGEIEHVLIPYSNGTWATAVSYDSYAYTHGGKVFRAAVEKCHGLIVEYIDERNIRNILMKMHVYFVVGAMGALWTENV